MDGNVNDNPLEEKKELPKSRRARKGQKAVGDALNKLLVRYFSKRVKVKDPKGKEMAECFTELNREWLNYCRRWNSNPKKLRNADGISPRKDAFESRVKDFTKDVVKQEKEIVKENKQIVKENKKLHKNLKEVVQAQAMGVKVPFWAGILYWFNQIFKK